VIVLAVAAAVSSTTSSSALASRRVTKAPAAAAIPTAVTDPVETTVSPSPSTTVPVAVAAPPPSRPTTTVAPTIATTTGPPPTTTTTEPMPSCQVGQFVLTATTDKGTYAPGETVMVDLSLHDTSPEACLDTGVPVWGCYGATASNSTGNEVWNSLAGPDSLPASCPTTGFPTTVPGNFSTTSQVAWTQDVCTQPVTNDQPNPYCPQTPVPSGVYQISAYWTVFPSSPPVTVVINPS